MMTDKDVEWKESTAIGLKLIRSEQDKVTKRSGRSYARELKLVRDWIKKLFPSHNEN